MADKEWELVIRDNAAEEDVPLLRVPPRLLKRLVDMLYIDTGADFQPSYQFLVILREVPDPAEADKIKADRIELNRLSAEAGEKIKRQLKDEGRAA